MPLRLLLVDDHKIMREGLRTLVARYPEMTVVGEAGDGASAVQLASELSPDIVIMDISMPGLNGIEATRRIRANEPRIRVVALSMHADRRFVLETLKAGASGYLLKDCAFEEIASALRSVAGGGMYLSARITDLVVREYMSSQKPDGGPQALTPREREVLQLVAEGQSTKDIAYKLAISVKTVETHRQQLMEKLGIHSVAELTKYAVREGITPL